MIDAATRIWAKINEFVGRIDKLEQQSDRTESDLEYLEKELSLLRKEAEHDRRVNAAIQKDMAEELARQNLRIGRLESEKHGKAVSAGIAKKEATLAKKELEKLRGQLKVPKDPNKRH
jgi:hypothetical protein